MVPDFWEIFADFVDSDSCGCAAVAAVAADFAAGNKADGADFFADMNPNYELKN